MMAFDYRDPDFGKISKGDLIYGIDAPDAKGKNRFEAGRQNYLSRKEFKVCNTIDQYDVIKSERRSGKITHLDRVAFVNALSDHPKYQVSVNGEFTNANIRMKDKGGIWWAVNNRKRVHFVLDGLDIEAVVKKNFAGTHDGKGSDQDATETKRKNRSITGAELRWIYRNRDNPNVQKNVQFWFEYCPVVPPWVIYFTHDLDGNPVKHDGPPLWAQYVNKLVEY
jgi:hypothetical protein